jgi:hypothetical protein
MTREELSLKPSFESPLLYIFVFFGQDLLLGLAAQLAQYSKRRMVVVHHQVGVTMSALTLGQHLQLCGRQLLLDFLSFELRYYKQLKFSLLSRFAVVSVLPYITLYKIKKMA